MFFLHFYYYFNLFDKFVYVFIQNLNSVHKEISWFIFYINLILLHRITVIIKYSHLYSYFLWINQKQIQKSWCATGFVDILKEQFAGLATAVISPVYWWVYWFITDDKDDLQEDPECYDKVLIFLFSV